MDIKDKNILITGGLGGFGLPLARALKDLGANIFIFDISTSDEFKCFQVDVTDENQVNQALSQIDRVDVLVNCAGEIYSEPFINFMSKEDKKHSRATWDRIIGNNLTSTFNMCVHVGEKMVNKRTKGVIINLSSVSAKGNAGQAAYSSAKAGVEALTKVIAKELGVFKIRAVAVAPGFIDTASTRNAMSEGVIENWIKQIPLKKLGHVEDIIETVKYIIACDHLTGCTISVDGGLSI